MVPLLIGCGTLVLVAGACVVAVLHAEQLHTSLRRSTLDLMQQVLDEQLRHIDELAAPGLEALDENTSTPLTRPQMTTAFKRAHLRRVEVVETWG